MSSIPLPPLNGFLEFPVYSARNSDKDRVVALIESCYQEHGDQIILNGDDSDLLNLEGNYRGRAGEFIIVEDQQQTVVGCHAVIPLDQQPHACTFKRLYLHESLRGQGLGQALMQWALDWARSQGFQRVEFWSDTRFKRAHNFFLKAGFLTENTTRKMDDGFQPYNEFFFWIDL
ncbi:MAG: GNAT family N-acetyltransferase [Planctomycetaceae bacterium]|nr:GNAT family N-acetyltransferase [Planctomycetaceae bacterium]